MSERTAKFIAKIHVTYVGEFAKTFRSQADGRAQNGEAGFWLGWDGEHQNIAYAICDWESLSSAKSFWTSARAKLQMSAWHAIGTPEFTYLEGPALCN